ncbi:MAG: hypothetical protein JWO80_5133 [Bryobacterales bacterium]|nr:hypothetical protein [Bryobacterales bacterium]
MRNLVFLVFTVAAGCWAQQSAQVLADILEQKGVIGASDRARIRSAGNEEGVQMLAAILREKGLLSADEAARITPAAQVVAEAAQRMERAAPEPVPVKSRIPIRLYGTVLFNAFSNTSLNNNQDVPSFQLKQGTDPTGGDKNFGMTARQSRFGMSYAGPEIAGAHVGGQVELDFSAGTATTSNGADYFVPRLRLAYARLDWTNTSLIAGQDWSVFAPLNPTSFANYSTAALTSSGNLWARLPQIRAEFRHSFSETSKVLYQIAATDPNQGDNPSTFASSRTAGVGERGRIPAFESRVSYTAGSWTLGLSGHYGHGKNAGTIGTRAVQTSVDSWGVAGDWTMPVGKFLTFTGEAYQGRSLGAYGGSLSQSVLPVGTPGEHGVETRGGWTQAQVNFTPKWQVNLIYGIELPNPHQLTTGLRDKDQTYTGNVMYKWSPNLTLAWEWRRFLTNFRNQQAFDEQGDHVNLAVAFVF